MKRTPYTTPAGVQIGLRYQPKPPQPSADAATIQAALLEPRTATHPAPTLRQRIAQAIKEFLQ